MTRFWVSWWSGNYADEGCTKPPFHFWCSGHRDRARQRKKGEERDEQSLCAVIDAENEGAVWELVKKHYPDFEQRFCEPKDADFKPGDRFPQPGSKDEVSSCQ